MRNFANEKYKVFQKLWATFDDFYVICGILMAFWLLVHVLLYGVLDNTYKVHKISVGLMAFFYANVLLGFNILLGYEKASIFVIFIICFFMIEIDVTRAYKHGRNQ